jgi:hypothetical protein
MDGGREENIRAYGSTATDNRAHVDEYSFSTEDKKDCGIADNETVVYPARNNIAPRRFEQIRRKYGMARVLKNVTTGEDPCAHMDIQAVAVPTEAVEAIQRERERRAADYIAQFKPNRDGNYVKKEDLFDPDERNYEMRRAINSQRFSSAGIGQDSETHGLTLEQGLEYYRRKGIDVERLGEVARRGGQHGADNHEVWKNGMSGKGFVVGAKFAPEVTPKSALGQIQAKARK